MKLHVPHPHAPNMFHRHAAADNNEHEEHHHPSKLKEELVHVKDEISHAVEHTLDTVEHGVDAVDPLHVFSPNEIPTRLVYQEGLLSQTARGDAFPIVCARSNDSYHELQVKANKNTEFVIENATTKKPVMILQQSQEQYDIYTPPSPIAKGQQQPSDAKGDDLNHYAKVIPSDKVLHVYLKEESEPTYVISKAGLAKSYSTGTKHVIRHFGEKQPVVATTQPWEGKSDMLEVHPGENVIFMYLLALIADEMLT